MRLTACGVIGSNERNVCRWNVGSKGLPGVPRSRRRAKFTGQPISCNDARPRTLNEIPGREEAPTADPTSQQALCDVTKIAPTIRLQL